MHRQCLKLIERHTEFCLLTNSKWVAGYYISLGDKQEDRLQYLSILIGFPQIRRTLRRRPGRTRWMDRPLFREIVVGVSTVGQGGRLCQCPWVWVI